MIRTLLYTVAMTLFLLGCGSTQSSLPYTLNITQEGLGPIHLGMPFDPTRIQSVLPGFTIEAVSQISPQQSPIILILKRGDTPIAYLLPDGGGKHIAQISIVSPLIKDQKGQSVGDPIKTNPALLCQEDKCHYTDFPAIGYQLKTDHTIREITIQKL